MLGVVANVGIRRAVSLCTRDPWNGGDGNARVEARHPVDGRLGGRAAAKQIDGHAIRRPSGNHGDTTLDDSVCVLHRVGRQEYAVLALPAGLFPVEVGGAVLEIAVDVPAVEIAIRTYRALEADRTGC